jgi:hypothetical protein
MASSRFGNRIVQFVAVVIDKDGSGMSAAESIALDALRGFTRGPLAFAWLPADTGAVRRVGTGTKSAANLTIVRTLAAPAFQRR